METIEILLASYNGKKYIAEMIESILAQDCQDWHLTVSDDQSSDGTAEILESFAQQYPERITHYRSGKRFGNAQNHFMHLLSQFHDAPYIMFCDQDDVWHSDKVSKTLKKMCSIELPGCPAMVHTDLRVVDGSLQEIAPSFMRLSGISGNRMEVRQLLIQNVVTGCTMMINRALAELASAHLPHGSIPMHDWWLALLASSCGTTGFLDEATIDYRQHGSNSVGASNARSLRFMVSRLTDNSIAKSMRISFEQAQSFEKCFSTVMPEKYRHTVNAYASLSHRGWLARKVIYFQYSFWKQGRTKQIGQILFG